MKVTALEEYGLRCMLLLAGQKPGVSLTLPEISAAENLSLPYAGKLLMILKKAGLVKALRGRNGGYVLSKSPHEITLKEVFSALGDSLYGSHHCKRYSEHNEDCIHSGECRVGAIWNAFNQYIEGVLENLTLAEASAGEYNLSEFSRPGTQNI